MREDLDRLMAEREIDWIVARGYPKDSSEVFYLVRGARIGECVVLKRRGEEPFVVVGSMERDEARAAGLRYTTFLDYGQAEINKENAPPLERAKKLFLAVLEKHGVRGRTWFGGAGPIASALAQTLHILKRRPEIEHVEEPEISAIAAARLTKSPDEIARMRDVARRTGEVVRAVCDLLRSCTVRGAAVLRPDGAPLKVGHVKDAIAVELARRGLDDKGQTIVAPGREAGFPHSRGTETEPVPAGRTIIFDIFPHEKGGGYHFDLTRTLWLGPVPDRVRQVFAAVEAAHARAGRAVRVGGRAKAADDAACDAFEERGFVTKRKDPRTEIGYCHSLGHGVGIEIHERPSLIHLESNVDVFAPGMVFTIEPGLYFPDEEIGVRIEDTYHLRDDGILESLLDLPSTPDALLAGGSR